jgi:hypothetical protein
MTATDASVSIGVTGVTHSSGDGSLGVVGVNTSSTGATLGVWGNTQSTSNGAAGVAGTQGRHGPPWTYSFPPAGVVGIGDGAGVVGFGDVGVQATGNVGAGVFASGEPGVLGSGSMVGVSGQAFGYGVEAQGNTAPLHLVPSTTGVAGPPTSGDHQMGELYVDSVGALFYCRVSGTPGTWVALAP